MPVSPALVAGRVRGRRRPGVAGRVSSPSRPAGIGVSTKFLAVALEMLPAVLFAHGTAGQRPRHLPNVHAGRRDLVPAPVRARRRLRPRQHPHDGAAGRRRVVVNGQKVWTSGAGIANFALLIARSDPESSRQTGVSCFALDMSDPGVEVRPLRQMSGGYHFNEVFLDGVFVPDDGLIGGLGDGWSVLRTMLRSERAAIGGGTSARSAVALMALVQRLRCSDDPVVRQDRRHRRHPGTGAGLARVPGCDPGRGARGWLAVQAALFRARPAHGPCGDPDARPAGNRFGRRGGGAVGGPPPVRARAAPGGRQR